MYGDTCVPLHTLRSQRTTCRISLSPFTMKVPGAELKSSSLVASPLNLSAILWTLAAVGLKEPESRAGRGGTSRADTAPSCSSQSSLQRPQPRWSWILGSIKERKFSLSQYEAALGFVKRKHFTIDLWGVTRKKGVQRKKKTHKEARVWLLQRKADLNTFITAAYEISVGAEVSASVGCLGM